MFDSGSHNLAFLRYSDEEGSPNPLSSGSIHQLPMHQTTTQIAQVFSVVYEAGW